MEHGERFSKKSLTDMLERRIAFLQNKHKFDTGNGTAQLKGSDVNRCVDYGRIEAMESILEEIS